MHQHGQVSWSLNYTTMSGKPILIIYSIYKTNLQHYSNSIILFKNSDSNSNDIKVNYSVLEDNTELSI